MGGKRKLRLDRCKVSVAEGGKPSKPVDKKGGKGQGGKGQGGKGQGGKGSSRRPINSKEVNAQLSASAFEGTRATKDDKSIVKPKKHRIRARTIAYKQKKVKGNK